MALGAIGQFGCIDVGDADPLAAAADRVAIVDGRSETKGGSRKSDRHGPEPSTPSPARTNQPPLLLTASPDAAKTGMDALQSDPPGPAAAGRAVKGKGSRPMVDPQMMPSALQVARAMTQVLRSKLSALDAEEITLTREEAALCLGLAEGVTEILEQDAEQDK